MDDIRDKTDTCIRRLRDLTIPGKELPSKEVKSILGELQGMHPLYRFYYDKLYRLVIVGPPDTRLVIPSCLYGQADLILTVQEDPNHEFRCDLLKDRDSVIETVGQQNRVMQAAFGLRPTGKLDETTLTAMAEVVKAAPKMTEAEEDAAVEARRNKYGRNLKDLKS